MIRVLRDPLATELCAAVGNRARNGLTLSLCTGRTWWFLYLKIPPIQWGLSFSPNRKPGVIRFKSPLLKSIRFKPTRVLYLYYEPHIFSSSDLWAFRWAQQNTNTVFNQHSLHYGKDVKLSNLGYLYFPLYEVCKPVNILHVTWLRTVNCQTSLYQEISDILLSAWFQK